MPEGQNNDDTYSTQEVHRGGYICTQLMSSTAHCTCVFGVPASLLNASARGTQAWCVSFEHAELLTALALGA